MAMQEWLWEWAIGAVERSLCAQRGLEQLDSLTATVEEAAVILRISRGSAYAAVRAGTLSAIVVKGRILIPITSLVRMLVEAEERAIAAVAREEAA